MQSFFKPLNPGNNTFYDRDHLQISFFEKSFCIYGYYSILVAEK